MYDELRQLTDDYFQRDRTSDTSEASGPVREAYLRMVNDSQVTERDRAHFYKIAAREMRRVLVEHSDEEGKNGNGGVDLVALDRALESFAETYPRKSEVVHLKFFAGLELSEISQLLQVSEETVLRDWNFARLWLFRATTNAA